MLCGETIDLKKKELTVLNREIDPLLVVASRADVVIAGRLVAQRVTHDANVGHLAP